MQWEDGVGREGRDGWEGNVVVVAAEARRPMLEVRTPCVFCSPRNHELRSIEARKLSENWQSEVPDSLVN